MGIVDFDAEHRIDLAASHRIAQQIAQTTDVEDLAVAFETQIGDATEYRFEHLFGTSHRLVVIDLLIHVVSAYQIRFDGMNGAVFDDETIGIEIEHLHNPIEIVQIIAYPRHIAISQNVIHAIGIELARYNRMIPSMAFLSDTADDAFWHAAIEIAQDSIDIAIFAQNIGASHRFVIEIANLRHPRFESMAKRRMTNIVQQCRRARHGSLESIAAWIGTVEHALGNVLSPNRMTKSRVFCSVVDEIRQTELTDSTQSLNDIGIDEGK